MTGLPRKLYLCFTFMTYVYICEFVLSLQSVIYIAVSDSEMLSSVKTMSVPSVFSCGLVCKDDTECVSFSYNNATGTCKLSDNDPIMAPLEVVASHGSTLYHLEECEEGWKVHKHTCYLFSLTRRNWVSSKAYCESLDASLVKVENDDEHQFIRHNLQEYYNNDSTARYFFIGLRYNETAGEFRWTDGTEISFDGWGDGKPGTSTGCVDYLVHNGWLWHPYLECIEIDGPSICEKGRLQMR